MKSTARNRIVVFRLSQDEYRHLREACDSHGARNLSDFTRSEVLTFLRASILPKQIKDPSSSLEQQIAGLQSAVNNLVRLMQNQVPGSRPVPGNDQPLVAGVVE